MSGVIPPGHRRIDEFQVLQRIAPDGASAVFLGANERLKAFDGGVQQDAGAVEGADAGACANVKGAAIA